MTQPYHCASEGKCHGRSAKPAQPSTSHMRAVVVIGFTRHWGERLYFGRFRTSLSHLVSRRLRSVEEPYLTKSKSISLISPSFGACGGTGVSLFEGTWNALDRAPNAWASGVSAQSYHFFALSALRPPLTIDIDPISYPAPSHGATTFIGAPSIAEVTRSC